MEINTFSKGLYKNSNLLLQPEGSYPYAKGFVTFDDGSLQNEQLPLDLETIGNLVGRVVLERTAYLLTDEGGLNRVYTFLDGVLTLKQSLPLGISERVQMVGKFNYLRQPVLYVAASPLRVIEVEKTYVDPLEETRWFRTVGHANSTLSLTQGNVSTGAYSFFLRYTDGLVPLTPWGNQTDYLSILNSVNQGGNHDLSKSGIEVNFTGLNQNFDFFEVAVAYYADGATFTAYSLGHFPVASSAQILFVNDALKGIRITLEELVANGFAFDAAKTVKEYKNLLVLSNLTSSTNSNAIEAWVETIEIQWQDIYVDAPQPSITLQDDGDRHSVTAMPILNTKATYQRSEVYAFGVVLQFKSGKTSPAFHIPCKNLDFIGREGEWATCKQYLSIETHKGQRIRHHVMPPRPSSLRTVPHLDLRAVFTTDLPSDIKSEVTGIYIVRQQRNLKANRRIESQGIAKPLIKLANGEVYEIPPFNGKGRFKYQSGDEHGSPPVDYNWFNTTQRNLHFERKLVAYYSPDTNFGVPIAGDKLEYAATLKGGIIRLDYGDYNLGAIQDAVEVVIDYDNQYGNDAFIAGQNRITAIQKIEGTMVAPSHADYSIQLNGETKSVTVMEDFGTHILALDSIPRRLDSPNTQDDGGSHGYDLIVGDRYQISSDRSDTGFIVHTELYNLVNDNLAQYGRLEYAEYIDCGYVDYNNSLPSPASIGNGDTFLCWYGLLLKSRARSDIRDASIIWSTFECRNNYNLMYYEANTVNSFPLERILWNNAIPFGVLNVSGDKGYPTNYDLGYSATRNTKRFVAKGLSDEEVQRSPNTIAWTLPYVEGARVDGWRNILPNSNTTISSSQGEITDSFVFGGNFYARTTTGLYANFGLKPVTTPTSIGEVEIGTGGMFTSPFELISSPQGGQGGDAQGLITPIGYVWVDPISKAIYHFSGKLEELSAPIRNYLREELVDQDPSICYDAKEKRILFNVAPTVTLSYSLKNLNWSSLHQYTTGLGFTIGTKSYFETRGILQAISEGERAECEIELVSNAAPQSNKSFDRTTIHTKVLRDEVVQENETFNRFRVYHDTQDSGYYPLKGVRRGAVYGDFIPAIASENSFNIATPGDALQQDGSENQMQKFKRRITGKYCVFQFKYYRGEEENSIPTYDTMGELHLYSAEHSIRPFIR